MKHILIGTVTGLILALFLALLIDHELSLLTFINMTFYIVGGLFTFSLLSLVIQKGFFDVTFNSFRKFSRSKHDHLDVEDEEIRQLSEIITLPYGRTFIVGLLLTCIMLVSLYVYYV